MCLAKNTEVNTNLVLQIADEFTAFEKNLKSTEQSLQVMRFLSLAFNKTKKVVLEEAEKLNHEIATGELDVDLVKSVLQEIAKNWEECDLNTQQGSADADRYSDVHKELSHVWPFRLCILPTKHVLRKLKSEKAKKFLELYKARGPAKVSFSVRNFVFF